MTSRSASQWRHAHGHVQPQRRRHLGRLAPRAPPRHAHRGRHEPRLQLQLSLQSRLALKMPSQPERPGAISLGEHEVFLVVSVSDAVVRPRAALGRQQAQQRRAAPRLLRSRRHHDQLRFRLQQRTPASTSPFPFSYNHCAISVYYRFIWSSSSPAVHLTTEATFSRYQVFVTANLILIANREDWSVSDIIRWESSVQCSETVSRAHQLVASGAAALVGLAEGVAAVQTTGGGTTTCQLKTNSVSGIPSVPRRTAAPVGPAHGEAW